MTILIAVVGVAVFAAILVFMLRKGASSSATREHELLRLCRGDREMMERLIALEIERGDDKTRRAAIIAAARSLKRDS